MVIVEYSYSDDDTDRDCYCDFDGVNVHGISIIASACVVGNVGQLG